MMQTSPKAPRPMILSVSKSLLCSRSCLTLDTTGLASNTTTDYVLHFLAKYSHSTCQTSKKPSSKQAEESLKSTMLFAS